ncbi:glycosyltransferase family 39 protein [bacterium]|nr:glycosyltransferase family 39 protein [bacterium]
MNQKSENSRNYSIYCLLTAFLLWIVFYIPFLRFQLLHVDEAVYLVTAKKILSGAVPYLDVWDHKPPMVYWLYAFILKLFGTTNFIPVNIVTLLFNMFSTIMIFKITKLFSNRNTAGLTALIYPVISNLLLFRDAVNPNTEIYMTIFSLCAVYLGLKGVLSKKKIFFLTAGLSVGIASAFKQPSGITLIPLSCAIIIFNLKDKKWKHIFFSLINLAVGFFIIWVCIGLYFLIKNGFWEFCFQAFKFNFLYSAAIAKSSVIRGIFKNYSSYLKMCPLFFIPYFAGLLFSVTYLFTHKKNSMRKKILLFILIWHVCDTLSVSTGGLFYYHYFVQWIPSLIIITFVPITFLFEILFKNYKTIGKVIAVIYILIFLIKIFVPAGNSKAADLVINKYRTPVENFKYAKKWAKAIGPGFYSYPYYREPKSVWGQMNIVKIIQTYVKPDKPIFVWGFAPEMYLLINRPSASRFLYTSFISGKFHGLGNLYDARNSSLKERNSSIDKLLLGDLQTAKPKFIIVSDKEPTKYSDFFFDYLSQHYKRLEIQTDMPIDIYILKNRNKSE